MTMCLSYCFIAVVKYSDRNDLKEPGSILSHDSKGQSTMVRKSELDVASHSITTVKKQKEGCS